MSRERLTQRVAEDMKSKPNTQVEAKGSGIDNDPYNMNDTGHEANDPKYDQYAKGDPSAWAEDPHMKNPAVDDGKREETGHAPLIDRRTASEAVAAAKKLEEKAVKCIVASQRMLPGASEEVIEEQAADFMLLPDTALNSTLERQEKLAKSIVKAAEENAEEAEESKEDIEDPEITAKKEKLASLQKEAAELQKELEAGSACDKTSEDEEGEAEEEKKEEEKEAGDMPVEEEKEKEEAEEKKKEEEKEAGDMPAEEEKEKEEAEEEKKDKEKEATEEVKLATDNDNLLDQIFQTVTASENKQGATSLKGMVKKEASKSDSNDISKLWKTDPDVSEIFG